MSQMVRLKPETIEKLNRVRQEVLASSLEVKRSKSVYGEHVSADEVVSKALDSLARDLTKPKKAKGSKP